MAGHNRFTVPITPRPGAETPVSQNQMRGITRVSQVRPGVDPGGRPEETYRSEIYTLFTKIGGNHLLYSAQSWVRVILRLETAGPVAVSTRESRSRARTGRSTR